MVSANTIMRAIHQVGEDCKAEDAKLAYSLYVEGVAPDSKVEAEEVFIEADGTYVSLQNGKKVEVKSMVAYSGKTNGERPERIDACRFGCVGSKDEFWTQSFAALAENFDVTKIKKVHAGFDGESTFKQAEKYFLINAEFDGDRFARVPRAWSVAGVDAIARIRSRKKSGRKLLFRNREESISEEVKERREKKVYKFLENQPLVFQKTVGHGYIYPVQAHLNQKIKKGLISAWSCCRKGLDNYDPY